MDERSSNPPPAAARPASRMGMAGLAMVACGWNCLAVLADEPVRLQFSDKPELSLTVPTLADPNRDDESLQSVEVLPPAVASPAYSRGATEELNQASHVLDTLHRELQQSDDEVARQFSRMRAGLDRLDNRFRTQTNRQQALLQQMETARRAAEQAAADAAAERQRLATLLSEPPWREVPPAHAEPDRSHTTPPPTSRAAASPPADPVTNREELAPAGAPEVLPDGTPIPLLNSTVDGMRLADSLYGAGQYDVAVRIYAKLANDPHLKAELPWLYLQLAGCYRHLGDDPAAARYYRMVAGMPQDHGFGETARWWLRHLEQRQTLQQGLSAIRTAVSAP